MKFEFVPSEEFYVFLYKNHEFCDGVGKVMLSAGRLETNLRAYLKAKGATGIRARSTLGSLVKLLKENELLSRNGEMLFEELALKRNYLAHSFYDLFSQVIEETIFPGTELTEMDADILTDRMQVLAEDFSYFADIVSKADKDLLL